MSRSLGLKVLVGMLWLIVGRAAPAGESKAPLLLEKGAADWKYVTAENRKVPEPDKNGRKWTDSDYDDSGWATGKAPLGFADRSAVTKVERFGGMFLRRRFEVERAVPADRFYMLLRVASKDSAEVYINGRRVERDPRFGSRVGHAAAYWNRQVRVSASVLRRGSNVIAVHLFSYVLSKSSFLDLELGIDRIPDQTAYRESLNNPPRVLFYLPLDGSSDGLGRNSVIENSTHVYLSGKGDPPVVGFGKPG